jgi:hypothetical protein
LSVPAAIMTEKMRVESIADAHDVDVIAARDIANEQPIGRGTRGIYVPPCSAWYVC